MQTLPTDRGGKCCPYLYLQAAYVVSAASLRIEQALRTARQLRDAETAHCLRSDTADSLDTCDVLVVHLATPRARAVRQRYMSIVAFRGSTQKEYREGLVVDVATFVKAPGSVGGRVSKAAWLFFLGVRAELEGVLQDASHPVLFCGFSLGGSAAAVAAAAHGAAGGTAHYISFASPRAGDAAFAGRLAALVRSSERVYHEGDKVADFPPAALGFTHVPWGVRQPRSHSAVRTVGSALELLGYIDPSLGLLDAAAVAAFAVDDLSTLGWHSMEVHATAAPLSCAEGQEVACRNEVLGTEAVEAIKVTKVTTSAAKT